MYSPRLRFFTLAIACSIALSHNASAKPVRCVSPNERNAIVIDVVKDGVVYSVFVDNRVLFASARCGPDLQGVDLLEGQSKLVDVQHGKFNRTFDLPWGKTKQVTDRCSFAVLTIESEKGVRWQVELRAYDDGVAFRYRLLHQDGLAEFTIQDERTQFLPTGEPVALFNTLDGFTTSHESIYERMKLSNIPTGRLIDCPFLLEWPDGKAAAIMEARVREFAGLYLERETEKSTSFRCRLSPLSLIHI